MILICICGIDDLWYNHGDNCIHSNRSYKAIWYMLMSLLYTYQYLYILYT